MVHAPGIEPGLLFRVMEALSHLAQRAKAGLHVNCPRLGCILTTGQDSPDFSISFLIVGQVSQLRRDSNPRPSRVPLGTKPRVLAGRSTTELRYCRDLTEMGWATGVEPALRGSQPLVLNRYTTLTMVGLKGVEPSLSTLSSLCLCRWATDLRLFSHKCGFCGNSHIRPHTLQFQRVFVSSTIRHGRRTRSE